jgi:hypothetical protein
MRCFESTQLDKPGFEDFVYSVLGDAFKSRDFVEAEGATLDFQQRALPCFARSETARLEFTRCVYRNGLAFSAGLFV